MKYLKVLMYPVIILLCMFIINIDWKRYKRIATEPFSKVSRLRGFSIVIISTIIGIYSLSYNHTFWWLDVAYYDRFFSKGNAFPDSIGLDVIYRILHLFTNNIDVLLFTIAFLATLVILISYNRFDETYPISLCCLFFTTFFIGLCQVSLKQAIACGLATLSINEMIKKRDLQAFCFLGAASLFHVTAGPILLLTYIVIKLAGSKRKGIKLIVYTSIFLGLIFFQQIFHLIGYVFSGVPRIAAKIKEYSSASGDLARSSSGWVALKGFPYYLITIFGFIKRKRGREYCKEYDSYLSVSFLASISYLLSYYTYWLTRIIAYYWMVDLVFFALICFKEELKSRNNKLMAMIIIGSMAVLTFRELILIYFVNYWRP